MKKIVKPKFYDSFKCIADKCPISCCREWKISVDKITEQKWKNLYLNNDKKSLLSQVITKDKERVIKLKNKLCPFLDESGLCRIVMELGEDNISQTCTIFPRQIHEFSERIEKNLVTCCPHVVDMINNEKFDVYEEFIKCSDDEATYIRSIFTKIIVDKKFSINNALLTSFYMLTEILNKGLGNLKEICNDASIKECSNIINEMICDKEEMFYENNELFLDVIDNYRKEDLYKDFLNPLASHSEKVQYMDYDIFETKFLEHDDLIRKWIINEYSCDLICPDLEASVEEILEQMILNYEWIIMEYAVIRQAAYLHFTLNEKDLSYDDLKKIIVYISRMTGYDEEDIFEYMDNSFESPIWEWGYMFLLLGK